RAARADVLLFLHADTQLAPGAVGAICEKMRDPRLVGGAFVRRYDSRSRLLALTCQLAALRNRLWGWHLGDQAMFVRGSLFRELGGFAGGEIFERPVFLGGAWGWGGDGAAPPASDFVRTPIHRARTAAHDAARSAAHLR